MVNILVIEDNVDLRKLFSASLFNAGYGVFSAADGKEGLTIVSRESINLVIADILMPNVNGIEFTKTLRASGSNVPVLMVTALDGYDSLEKCFSVGVDDYMVKPINLNEMLLRISALLRRARINSEKKIVIGQTLLDGESLTASVNGENIDLTLKEFNLLFKLLSYQGRILTRMQLMDEIWGMDSETDDRTINTHINRLREKFSHSSDFEIITVRGLGYKAVKNEKLQQ